MANANQVASFWDMTIGPTIWMSDHVNLMVFLFDSLYRNMQAYKSPTAAGLLSPLKPLSPSLVYESMSWYPDYPLILLEQLF